VLKKVGTTWRTGPSTVIQVIEQIPESQFHWKTYASPHSAKDDLGVLIGQFQNGGIQRPAQKGGGKLDGQARAIANLDAYRQRMNQTIDYQIVQGEVL